MQSGELMQSVRVSWWQAVFAPSPTGGWDGLPTAGSSFAGALLVLRGGAGSSLAFVGGSRGAKVLAASGDAPGAERAASVKGLRSVPGEQATIASSNPAAAHRRAKWSSVIVFPLIEPIACVPL